MAQNNALAVATLLLADERETGVSLSADKIETLCNMYGTPVNIVRQVMDECREDIKKTLDYGVDSTLAIAIAKGRDIDDDDLKDATKFYMLYTNAVQRLKDKYANEVADLRVGIQETINRLKNPENE